MDNSRMQFFLTEYTTLRSELVQQYKFAYNWVIYVFSANGVIAIWTLENLKNSQVQKTLIMIAIFIPFIITLSGIILLLTNIRAINMIAKYLREVELENTERGGITAYYMEKAWSKSILQTRYVLPCLLLIQFFLNIIFAWQALAI